MHEEVAVGLCEQLLEISHLAIGGIQKGQRFDFAELQVDIVRKHFQQAFGHRQHLRFVAVVEREISPGFEGQAMPGRLLLHHGDQAGRAAAIVIAERPVELEVKVV